MDISDLRGNYESQPLRRADLAPEPVKQFERWFVEACDANLVEPNAMGLATVSADGQPGQRAVLLKYFDASGFMFFTNLHSAKAQEIQTNPKVSLLFTWLALQRQVIIQGVAERLSVAESLRYFASRPRGSQLGAWVSRQSSVISSRQILEMKLDEMKQKFARKEVPLPSFWGGYRVRPVRFEFWQGRQNRLHDRFRYTPDAEGWAIARLAP